MQVQVHHVEAHVARAHLPQDGVEVGPVVVEQPTGVVDRAPDRLDAPLEDAEGRGVGEHDPRRLGTHRLAQGRRVHVAVAVGRHLPDPVPAHGGARRVGSVRGVRHQDLHPLPVAAGLVVGADHGDTHQLALGAGHRSEGHLGHAGHRLQDLLEIVQAGEDALAVRGRRRGVAVEEPGQAREPVADPRVVLHRARPERVEVGVDGEVLLGQARVVAHRLKLRDLGQRGRRLAQEALRDVGRVTGARGDLRPRVPAGARLFEDQHRGAPRRRTGRQLRTRARARPGVRGLTAQRWPSRSPAPGGSPARARCRRRGRGRRGPPRSARRCRRAGRR